MSVPPPKFNEAAVTAILRRAAEVDVERAGAIDVVRLREIASQVGISAPALQQAVREYELASARRVERTRWWRRRLGIAFVVTVSAFATLILGFASSNHLSPTEAVVELLDLQ